MMELDGFINASIHLNHYDFPYRWTHIFWFPNLIVTAFSAKSLPGLIAAPLAPAHPLLLFLPRWKWCQQAEGKRDADAVASWSNCHPLWNVFPNLADEVPVKEMLSALAVLLSHRLLLYSDQFDLLYLNTKLRFHPLLEIKPAVNRRKIFLFSSAQLLCHFTLLRWACSGGKLFFPGKESAVLSPQHTHKVKDNHLLW